MSIPLSKLNEKDNFHNLILCIDKMVALGIVYSTILSKFSLSERGGGWRKTFKISSKTPTSFRKSGNFPAAQMREAYKDAPPLVGVLFQTMFYRKPHRFLSRLLNMRSNSLYASHFSQENT